jgi:hypothetical protein
MSLNTKTSPAARELDAAFRAYVMPRQGYWACDASKTSFIYIPPPTHDPIGENEDANRVRYERASKAVAVALGVTPDHGYVRQLCSDNSVSYQLSDTCRSC